MRSPTKQPASAWVSRRLKMRALETERLVLREFQQDDVKDLVGWQRDSGAAYTEAEARSFLNFAFQEYVKWGIGPWGIVLKKTGVVIGSCGFCDIDLARATGDVNYFVTPQHRRHGLATEALGAILHFGFDDLELTRIEARCIMSDVSSERVAQKAGMIFERVIPSDEDAKDEGNGFRLHAITRRDFEKRRLG